ncbi:MAG: tetratricopeptide repeat protein [Chloroflexi bacterium]|nr:tetratricopeptide repeat protein [Chloroflexota bacterium]
MERPLIGNSVERLKYRSWMAPVGLLAVCFTAYGLLFPFLGWYWDEWPITWIANKLGNSGLVRYFETNRPYWGMIYGLTTGLIGAVPWRWQLFGLFWRWLGAVLIWAIARTTWPNKEFRALTAGMFFAVWPSFTQQSIAMMYGHFFIVLDCFLLSLWLNLKALNNPREKAWYILAGLPLAAVNLLAMEYFFLLEVVRPVFLWAALYERQPEKKDRNIRLRLMAALWLPFLLVFAGAGYWRAFLFPHQTHNYQPVLITGLKTDPCQTLLTLAITVIKDIWTVLVTAWGQVLRLPDAALFSAKTTVLYFAGLVILAILIAILVYKTGANDGKKRSWPAVVTGLVGLLSAGIPFWLTGLPVGLGFPNDRFTLPFLLGASLVLASVLELLPQKNGIRAVLTALLVAAAVGLQIQTGFAYRKDWNTQRNLFWQLSWRAPALKPGTAVVSTNLPLRYFSDNSLVAPLNWVYAPDNHSPAMNYMFYYASVRADRALKLEPGQQIYQGYLASDFTGSSDQLLMIDFQPPACLRVLDADYDPVNPLLSPLMREAAKRSNPSVIVSENSSVTPARSPDTDVFGPEPARGWCYYFEKASLLADQGNWQAAADLGDQAFALGDYPNDPMERFVFIEAYARTGNLERARELSDEVVKITPQTKAPLDKLWERIESQQ